MIPPSFVAAFFAFGAIAFALGYVAGYIDGWTSRRFATFMVRIYRAIRYGRKPAASRVGP